MSKLNFASLNDAFILGSQQIKDTQEEISKLKSLVLETSGLGPTPVKKENQQNYTRVGAPDITQATFNVNDKQENIDTLIDKLIQSPRFSDVVAQYISSKYPNLQLSGTSYQPAPGGVPPVVPPGGVPPVVPPEVPPAVPPAVPSAVPSAVSSKESFGAVTCDTTKNMVIFILVAFMIYIFFGLFFDR